ncbi:MAG TPA: hypothetical protein VEV16_12320 [Daejeonella sp.]|nr:hypothetical protein [Daejeonella sp.]
MRLSVTDPSTGYLHHLEATPEKRHGEQGYRIIYENGSNFFIANKYGSWRIMDDHHVDSIFLENIGLAIEHWGPG